MSRSDKHIKLYEGFKLGSLGVSRKPKIVDEPKEPEGPTVRGFIKQTERSVDWTETATPEIIKKVKATKKLPPDVNARVSMFVVRTEQEKSFLRCFITLRDAETDKALGDGLFELPLGTNMTDEAAVDWFNRKLPYMKRDGLAAVSFPINTFWKEV
jgi:hypothetical protein